VWAAFALLPPVIVIGLIVAGVVGILRWKGGAVNITFPGVLLAYTYVAIFVSVFLISGGGGVLIKAGLGAADKGFSYNTELEEDWARGSTRLIDVADREMRDDLATGITLMCAGVILFAIHGTASVALRNRRAPGQRLISRSYNVLGLAVSTVIFLTSAATALHNALRRYLLDPDAIQSWDYPRPGAAIGFAVVFLPLVVWFAWRVWQEFASEGPAEEQPAATSPDDAAVAVIER
jgi:hypothetical protein